MTQAATLFVPDIGVEVTLAEDWTFVLYPEQRNAKLWESAGFPSLGPRWGKNTSEYQVVAGENATLYLRDVRGNSFTPYVTLPKGTVLKCSRVYIRQNAQTYSSLTWTISSCPDTNLKGRFWAKLTDCNKMIIELP